MSMPRTTLHNYTVDLTILIYGKFSSVGLSFSHGNSFKLQTRFSIAKAYYIDTCLFLYMLGIGGVNRTIAM